MRNEEEKSELYNEQLHRGIEKLCGAEQRGNIYEEKSNNSLKNCEVVHLKSTDFNNLIRTSSAKKLLLCY